MSIKTLVVILGTLVGCTIAINDVVLVENQNYTMSNTNDFTGGSVSYVNTDDTLTKFVVSDQKTLQFMLNVNGTFDKTSAYNFVIPDDILEMRFRGDGAWLAVCGKTSTVVYFLTQGSLGRYEGNHNVSVGSLPTSVSWTYHEDTLAVGLANGSLAVLELNSATGKFYVRQMINTNHVGGIAKVFGKKARIYSVGGSDSILQVWWLNTTTQVWSLNQTLNDVGKATNRATAMHVSRNEKRIGIGRNNGDIIILGHPDENYLWSINKTITRAHSASVNFIRFTRNGWHFLSGAGDGVVRLWTKNDEWTVPANTTLNGQSVDWDDKHKQYTVGLYSFDNGKFTTQYLSATNCANGYDSSDKTRCTCGAGLTWVNGGCNTLTCEPAPFKNINGFNSTTGSTSCACDAGYVWDETTLICIRDCSTAATPNSKGTNYEFLSC
jgi:WD40 repeat protein